MSGILSVLMATTDESGGGGGGGGSLVASASPDNLLGFSVATVGGTVVTSEPSMVTATGGVLPYTYTWTRTSGDTAIYAETPTGAYTYFASTFLSADSRVATFKCTVTDAAATVIDTNIVSVTLILETIYIGGGVFP